MSEIDTKKYLDYIRQQPHCCLCYNKGKVEPHHINMIGMRRDRKKNLREHYSAVPVCRPCHQEYHQLGEKAYSKKHNINPYELAWFYLANYLPHKDNE